MVNESVTLCTISDLRDADMLSDYQLVESPQGNISDGEGQGLGGRAVTAAPFTGSSNWGLEGPTFTAKDILVIGPEGHFPSEVCFGGGTHASVVCVCEAKLPILIGIITVCVIRCVKFYLSIN